MVKRRLHRERVRRRTGEYPRRPARRGVHTRSLCWSRCFCQVTVRAFRSPSLLPELLRGSGYRLGERENDVWCTNVHSWASVRFALLVMDTRGSFDIDLTPKQYATRFFVSPQCSLQRLLIKLRHHSDEVTTEKVACFIEFVS